MEQIQVIQSTIKKHWVLDNDSIGILSENFSNEDVESVGQQIKAEPNDATTELKKYLVTEHIRSKRENIKIPYDHFQNRFNILKKSVYTKNTKTWKGVVTGVNSTTFKAKLYDLNNHTGTYETAEFNIKTDTTEQDLELIEIGAVFYWSVGNIIQNKTQTKQSEIRFRRIADITASEFDELHDSLKTNYGNIKWD